MMTLVKKRENTLLWTGLLLWIAGCSWYQPHPAAQSDAEKAIAIPEFDWGGFSSEPLMLHIEAEVPESPPGPPEAPFLIHTISRQGETLIALARWYTGEGRNWMAIAAANPGLEPTRIHIGDTIKIPKDLLITRKPLPRVNTATLHRPQKSSPRKPKPIETDLFGPIVTPSPAGETGREILPVPLETIE